MAKRSKQPPHGGYRVSEISATALAKKGYRVSEWSQSEQGQKDDELSENKESPGPPAEQEGHGVEPGATKAPKQATEAITNVPAYDEPQRTEQRSRQVINDPMKMDKRAMENRRPVYLFVGAVTLTFTLSMYILAFSSTTAKPARLYQFADTEESEGTPEFLAQNEALPPKTTPNETNAEKESVTEKEIGESSSGDADPPKENVHKRRKSTAAFHAGQLPLYVEDPES